MYVGGIKVKIKSEMFPMYCILGGMMAIFFSQPVKFLSAISLGTYSIALGTFWLFGRYLRTIVINHSFIRVSFEFFLLVYLFVLSIVSMLANWSVGYESLVKLITFMELPILLICIRMVEFKKCKKILQNFFLILGAFFICVSFTDLAYSYTTKYGITTINDLTLGYNNPNETAMYLYICFSVLLSFLFDETAKKTKRLNLIILSGILCLIFLTKSRVCILLAVTVLFYAVFLKKHKLGFVERKIIWIFPVLFLVFTLSSQTLFQNIRVMGDAIETGRYSIYITVLQDMNLLQILIGDFSLGFANMHNALLSVFGTIGILGSLVYVLYLYVRIEKDYKKRHNNIAFFAIYMLIVHSSVEAGLLLSGSVYAALVFCLYLIAVAS